MKQGLNMIGLLVPIGGGLMGFFAFFFAIIGGIAFALYLAFCFAIILFSLVKHSSRFCFDACKAATMPKSEKIKLQKKAKIQAEIEAIRRLGKPSYPYRLPPNWEKEIDDLINEVNNSKAV